MAKRQPTTPTTPSLRVPPRPADRLSLESRAREAAPRGFVFCPASNRLPVHDRVIAIPVRRGRKGWAFIRCTCGSTVMLPRLWTDDMGYSYDEVMALNPTPIIVYT